jgi:hypothetical protein
MSTIAGQQVGFGLIYGFQPFAADRLIAEAQDAESLGFDLFCVPDHLHGAHPTPEPWTALSWIAAVTERIAVMPDVLGLPYRAPAVTAKMAETLDRLSAGTGFLLLRRALPYRRRPDRTQAGSPHPAVARYVRPPGPGHNGCAGRRLGSLPRPAGPRSGGGHARHHARQRRGRRARS